MYIYRVDEKMTIRVADFGLTKDVYSTEYYRAEKHAKLPVKWMSLESLLDGYFDEKSDVVCFVCVYFQYMYMYSMHFWHFLNN